MRGLRRICVGAAAASVALIVGVLPPASVGAAPNSTPTASVAQVPRLTGPAQTTHADASRYARQNPGSVPVGVNDFDCVPSEAQPRPVVLLHGTDSTAYSDYAAIGPRLSEAGYCVFALNYGGRAGSTGFGTEDMRASGAQVATFVDQVLTATGSSHVDIVGYSQGATVARYYIDKLGGSVVVKRWVGLASPSYGGTLYGLVPLAEHIPGSMDLAVTALPKELVSAALWQQSQGSPFLDDLNNPTDTVAGVEYTTIASQVDEVIQPATNVALGDPAATNHVLQELCPGNLSGHFRMPYDALAISLVMTALDPRSATTTPACSDVPLGEGVLDMVISENS